MGWAKYAEDNLELLLERHYMKDAPKYIRITATMSQTQHSPTENNAKKLMHQQRSKAIGDKEEIIRDKILCCKDCGKQFLFSASAQKMYKENSWVTPKRCKCCRETNTIRRLMQPTF